MFVGAPEDAPTGGKCPPPKARRWAWMARIRSFHIVSVPYGFESRYDLHDHGINLRDSGIIYKTDALHHNTVSFGNIIFDKICLINCSRSGTSRYTMNERAVFSALYGGRNNPAFYKVYGLFYSQRASGLGAYEISPKGKRNDVECSFLAFQDEDVRRHISCSGTFVVNRKNHTLGREEKIRRVLNDKQARVPLAFLSPSKADPLSSRCLKCR